MKFLARIRADLQRSLAEQQRAAVLAVLRARLGELTFDDIRELLASPLGKGLGAVRVLDLLDGTAPPTTATPTAAKPKPRAKRRERVRKRKKPHAKPLPGKTVAQEVLRVLGAAKTPLWRGAIAERIGVDPPSLKHPLQLLVYDGSIIAEGPANRRLYSLPKTRPAQSNAPGPIDSGEISVADAAKPPSRKKPKRTRRRSAARKAKRPTPTKPRAKQPDLKRTSPRATAQPRPHLRLSPEKIAELARYGAVLLDAVKAAGGWISSADLRARTGGTRAQFQRAAKKLEVSGAIARRGEKSLTHYAPAGTPG